MNVVPFEADSAAEAVAQIRERLGPDAVVLNVRRLPANGLARFWPSRRIEVLACVPDSPPAASEVLTRLQQELAELREQLSPNRTNGAGALAAALRATAHGDDWLGAGGGDRAATLGATVSGGWRVGAMLESAGFLPVYAQRVVEHLRAQHGDRAPASLANELLLARQALADLWRPAPAGELSGRKPVQVFVGPPGAGKTTCLCKWLALVALGGEQRARVWRLDGQNANTAEGLSVYADLLGVRLERLVPADVELEPEELVFVDLPGISTQDASAMEELGRRITEWPPTEVHLVLNSAYETTTLLSQARAFASLPIQDVIVTHLDEEPRWGKLWNLVLGTNCSLRFLSAGQNVPGQFQTATAEGLLARVFP